MSFEPQQKFGRYTVLRLLAQGGMAEVYSAEQEMTGGIIRPVALKVIRPELADAAEFRQMFLDEARTACALSHPNIVSLYNVDEHEGVLYMAMELVGGDTVAAVHRELRDRHRRFSDEAILNIGIYTCAALEAVHGLKRNNVALVHRDVSPNNLMLSSAGTLKLIDFGIAQAASNRSLTQPGITKGKTGYFSPEQAMGKRLDGRSDLFSLGVTLYKLFAGANPFDQFGPPSERNAALVRGEWPKLEQVAPGLYKGIYATVERAMQMAPDQRYADAKQMREALEKVSHERGFRIGPASLSGYVSVDGVLKEFKQGTQPALAPIRDPLRKFPRWALAALSFLFAGVVGGGITVSALRAAKPGASARLHIETVPPSAAGRVWVGGDDWGPPPIDRAVPSGQHRVVFKPEGGHAASEWKGNLAPEKTTELRYDMASQQWVAK